MNYTKSSTFEALTDVSLMQIDGGASVGEAIAGTLGVAAILWAAPVAIVVAAPALGVGMALAGAGAVVNMVLSTK